jgi:hypothetical protein
MERPGRFEEYRFLGDKRNQIVYDLDADDPDGALRAEIDDVLAAQSFAVFGPDSLTEARNRGYRPRAERSPEHHRHRPFRNIPSS